MDWPVLDLALDIARRPAAGLDPAVFLPDVCAALAAVLGLPAAALVLVEPESAHGSDGAARRIADVQRREGSGPLIATTRSGRVLPVPDLGRAGPPALAAAVADCGLVSGVAVPLGADGRYVAGLQLLGTRGTPVTPRHVEAARPVLDVLGALLANLQAQHQLVSALAREAESRRHAAPIEQATGVLAERYRTDVEEAARYLESQASADGRLLVAAAEAVVASAARPAPVPRPRGAEPAVRASPRPRGTESIAPGSRILAAAPRPAPGPQSEPASRPQQVPAPRPRSCEPIEPHRQLAHPPPRVPADRDGPAFPDTPAPRARHRRIDVP